MSARQRDRATARPGRAWVVVALLGAALAAPGAAQVPATRPAADATAGVSLEPARPGDVVRIRVWREPDLSGDFAVEETGVVVIPRIGPIQATEETAESLRRRVTAAFEEFLPHSSISVTLLRRVQILGAVRNPGLYPVDPTMTVADALALAGGPTIQGKANTVELIRDGQRVGGRLSGNTPLAGSQLRSGDQLYVPERSWISRNAGVVSAALTATVSIMIALMRG